MKRIRAEGSGRWASRPGRERRATPTTWTRGCWLPLLGAACLVAAFPARSEPARAVPPFTVEAETLALPEAVRRLPAALAQGAGRTPGALGALGDASLDALRGGAATPWSDMSLGGTVGGNTAVNVVTGTNQITDGAFSNASGLPMVIQNSGANVLIQNATIVNVQVR
uniref:hypothetical protein n=1 Tax=Massilia sp. METH4 TaxID=3123041 RepID=UPI00403EF70D